MQRRTERLAAVVVLVVSLMVALGAPAAAATNQISGVAFIAPGGECPPIPDYMDFPPLRMTGSLEGCWYTNILSSKDNGAPSGVYQERGVEIFVGSLDGGAQGRFETTYKFSSKWSPDVSTGTEVHGRCQHPIVAGSGTGAFTGVSGRVDFKDDVVNSCFLYRGHLSFR